MPTLRSLPIGWRLAVLGGVGVLVAGVVGGIAVVEAARVDRARATVVAMDGLDLLVTQADVEHSNAQLALRDAAAGTTAEQRASAEAEEQHVAAAVDGLTRAMVEHEASSPADVRVAVDAYRTAVTDYLRQAVALVPTLARLSPADPQVRALLAADGERVDTVDRATTAAEDLLASRSAAAGTELGTSVTNLRRTVSVALAVGLVVMIVAALAISRSITAPVHRMVQALRAVAGRDLTVRLADGNADEIGAMSTALDEALTAIGGTMGALGGAAGSLTTASERLTGVATELEGSARATHERADEVSVTAGGVSDGVSGMSAATEQMSASIREIAQNASHAADVAQAAVRTAGETSGAVSELGRASAEIGDILRTITAIAEQTNLLALNATIEAARAGEAGKGFAVVATEVKDLAQATARATDDIAAKIEAIQGTTARATDAIMQIGTVVTQINDIQTTIAAAVEEQSATTAEISRSVSGVAAGSDAIAGTIAEVARVAGTASEGAATTSRSASELTALAADVQRLVAGFRY